MCFEKAGSGICGVLSVVLLWTHLWVCTLLSLVMWTLLVCVVDSYLCCELLFSFVLWTLLDAIVIWTVLALDML